MKDCQEAGTGEDHDPNPVYQEVKPTLGAIMPSQGMSTSQRSPRGRKPTTAGVHPILSIEFDLVRDFKGDDNGRMGGRASTRATSLPISAPRSLRFRDCRWTRT